jgi:diadenylate cyclase
VDWLSDNVVMQQFVRPALDILLLAYLFYRGWNLLIQTRAVQLAKGFAAMVAVYVFAFFLKLDTLLLIMNTLFPGLVIALAIIFQPELRRVFTRIGQGGWFRPSPRVGTHGLETVTNSVDVLSSKHTGALLVFTRSTGLKHIIETGTRLNAELSSSLLLTIFANNTPLHDGAVIITGNRIVAAGCFLPLSEQSAIRRSFGTRHRAALGLVEETDAVVVVVSEENGAISVASDANLLYDLSLEELGERLKDLLEFREREDGDIEE